MLYHRIQTLIQELVSGFHARDFRRVLSHYDFPVGLGLEDESFALHRPRELEALLRDHASLHEAERMVETRFSISAVELPRNGRFRVWVRYFHLDQAGQVLRQSDRVLRLRDRGNALLIEEVQVTRLPFAQMRAWAQSRRLSA